MAVKGRYPSHGLRVLKQTGWIANFPVLQQMFKTSQDPVWRPEGDVYTHTGHVCDAAAEIADREGLNADDRTILMFAALCHDFGKTVTTEKNMDGRWVAPHHAQVGVSMTKRFLSGIRAPGWVIENVLPLVLEHMAHIGHPPGQAPSDRVVRRLAGCLAPATIRMWSALCESDASGRPPKPPKNPVLEWVDVAEVLRVRDSRPRPLLLGRHLIPLGYRSGPSMGKILKAAFQAQLDGEFDTIECGTAWVQANHPIDEE